jgi:hypothetical protein
MSVLPLLWESRRMLLILTAFHLSCYCFLSLIHVLHVFNHAITCSVFPTMWKSVIIWPVVASPSCPSDFRPITIVSVLSKGFERLINGQILAHAHVDRSGLLSEFQSGFRCGHSTTTASLGLLRI